MDREEITFTDDDDQIVNYTYVGDGLLSCSSSDESVAICNLDTENNTVTVTPLGEGTASIVVKAEPGKEYNMVSKSISVTVPTFDVSLTTSTDTLNVGYPDHAKTFTYEYTGRGGVICTVADPNLAKCNVNDETSTVTVTPLGIGNTSVTLSNKLTMYNPVSASVNVNISYSTYTIKYNALGGTGAPSTQTKTYMVDLELSSEIPTLDKGEFQGWSITSDASAVTYLPGDTITINNDLTLYAVYKLPTAYAVYSADDTSLRFYRSDTPITAGSEYNGLTATAVYTGFETATYSSSSNIPWYGYRSNITTVVFEDYIFPQKTNSWFSGLEKVTSMDLTKLNTSKVTTMSSMFSSIGKSVAELNIEGLDKFDTSSVTDMGAMFSNAGQNVTNDFILDLSGWDTSNVIGMSNMFYYAGQKAPKFELIGIDSWDTSSVTNMSCMFSNAGYNATEWYVGDIGKWNTSKVTDMTQMFYYSAYNSTNIISLNLSNWKISRVKEIKQMFYNFGMHSSAIELNLSNWNVSNVTNMELLFCNVGFYADDLHISGLDTWDTSSVITMNGMFQSTGYSATEWSIGNLSGWDTSNVTRMNDMFSSAGYSATEWYIGDLSGWDTSKVTNMQQMFHSFGKSTLRFELNLSGWDTSKVTNMNAMFDSVGKNATIFKLIGLNTWDVSNVTIMTSSSNTGGMFKDMGQNVEKFELDLSGWDLSMVTDFTSMFEGTGYNSNVVKLNLSNWKIPYVAKMTSMFASVGYNANELHIKGLDTWDVSSVTNMGAMFYAAGKSATEWNIGDLSGWDTSNVTSMGDMFYQVPATKFDLSGWDTSNVTDMDSMFEGATNVTEAYARTQADADRLNASSNKPTTWQFISVAPVVELTIDNQSSDLVTITDIPDVIEGGITEITLTSVNSERPIYSFKLNGEIIYGNTFIAPMESGTVTISDVEFLTINVPDDVTIETPDVVVPGTTILTLVPVEENKVIVSFSMNGTSIDGNTFVVPLGSSIVTITDVVLIEPIIIESEHNPYPNSMNATNADGTQGKVYGEATFDGATSLTVLLDYQTESTNYDWIYLYDVDGNIVNNTKYGGSTRTQKTITVPGDYVKILFRTDGSGNSYYGFHATITPNY